MTGDRICLDLFAGLGGFSAAFQDADHWDVYTVDRDPDFDPDLTADVYNLAPRDLLEVTDEPPDVVLAGHPCTLMSTAGNHDEWDFETGTPTGDRARYHVALAHHTIGLIQALTPDYWFLENPRGRMRWVLGEPTGTVTYCQYGKNYQKPTDLWGRHPSGLTYRSCPTGANCHNNNTETDGSSAVASMPSDIAERALVPRQLSEAIKSAVDAALNGESAEQTTLTGVSIR